MRVLCVNDRLYYVNLGLFSAMTDRGYDVRVIPLGSLDRFEQRVTLVNQLEEFKPDIVFTPGWSIGIFDTEQFLSVMDHSKVPHIYWATEDPLFFDEVSMKFAPHADYILTTAEECVPAYRSMGKRSSTLLFGCNPSLFHPVAPRPEYQHDIVLAANRYSWFGPDKTFRRKAIRNMVLPLLEAGYDIHLWGEGWNDPESDFQVDAEHCSKQSDYLESPAIYSSAKIVLGIQSVNTSKTQTSCRTYEIMGCGAFLLTCRTPSHESLFENHRHLVWSESAKETLELVDYYLSHEAEREAIAKQGQEEVLQKHTYAHRLDQMEQALRPLLARSAKWPPPENAHQGRTIWRCGAWSRSSR